MSYFIYIVDIGTNIGMLPLPEDRVIGRNLTKPRRSATAHRSKLWSAYIQGSQKVAFETLVF